MLTLAPNRAQHAVHAHALHGLHGCGLAGEIDGCVGDRVEEGRGEGGAGVVVFIGSGIVVVDVGAWIVGVCRSSISCSGIAAQWEWRSCRSRCR